MTQEFIHASAESLARLHTKEAIGAAVEVLRDKTAFPGDRLKAAQLILDRGHGKPTSVSVQVPAKRAVAAQLANMSEDQLMAILQSRQRNAPTDDSTTAQTPNLPARWHGHTVTDAEYTEKTDDELLAERFAAITPRKADPDDPSA